MKNKINFKKFKILDMVSNGWVSHPTKTTTTEIYIKYDVFLRVLNGNVDWEFAAIFPAPQAAYGLFLLK